eukprot:CAMPEP_0204565294 /NCGR_PEP_ID=MMETSP0661-20131031/35388_1 /ASSEMBLY_ACC=CAM_ASM_000606 /TAXON_ID=109239 /ORGANISM="Alexandrium margalefi, Strain AMGDE01CS-322" /LENGTH=161 /DNA_ID=CAMNT_0051573027 /DNA_START=168 /DNA_END=649 /DNA_ORIENTATION=-
MAQHMRGSHGLLWRSSRDKSARVVTTEELVDVARVPRARQEGDVLPVRPKAGRLCMSYNLSTHLQAVLVRLPLRLEPGAVAREVPRPTRARRGALRRGPPAQAALAALAAAAGGRGHEERPVRSWQLAPVLRLAHCTRGGYRPTAFNASPTLVDEKVLLAT